ncbi:MAG: enoyl-CoA hydratase/isomerase family protein [Acidimicrobiales bacterium]
MELYDQYPGLDIDMPEPGILRIVIDTPGKLNAVDAQKHHDLAAVWRTVDTDPAVRVVVIHGANGAFSAGGDMAMIHQIMDDAAFRAQALREARDIVHNMVNCSKPIISAIERVAVGAGIATALMADISIVGRTAKLIDGHTKIGVAAGDHAVAIWPLLIGMAKAKYYLLTCEPMTGEEADRMGLVSMCVDDDQVIDKAFEVARSLNNGAQASNPVDKAVAQ